MPNLSVYLSTRLLIRHSDKQEDGSKKRSILAHYTVRNMAHREHPVGRGAGYAESSPSIVIFTSRESQTCGFSVLSNHQ